MAAEFLSDLWVHLSDGDEWVLDQPLVYNSDILGKMITVPRGFKTDFASVPRLPLSYAFFGNVAHKAAVVHDFLYQEKLVERKLADDVFYEAMEASGVWAWRRWPMYWAVRLFGGPIFEK